MSFLARRATLVTEATPDYVTGDLCGGKTSFIMRTPGGGGKLVRACLKSIDAISVDSVLHLFDSDPSATTFTENGAFALNSADRTRLLRSIAIGSADWINQSTATGLYIAEKAIDVPFLFATGDRTIYGALVAAGTINLSSTSSIEIILGAEVD